MVGTRKKAKPKRKPVSEGPFDIGDGKHGWFYVDPNSITVVVQLWSAKSGYQGTTQATITRRELGRALKLWGIL